MYRPLPRAASGRTLIELLISMTIGLIIAAFVAGIYLSSAQTARVSSQAATMEDSGRTIMTMIGNGIKQAGYGEIVSASIVGSQDITPQYRASTLFGRERHLVGCADSTVNTNVAITGNWADVANPDVAIVCTQTAGGALANTVGGNDALMVRYQGDTAVAALQGSLNDCLGVPAADTALSTVDQGHQVTSRPIVQNMYFVAGGALRCNGNSTGAAGLTQDLIVNVEQFKLFYGYDDVRAGGTFVAGTTTLQPSIRSVRDAGYLNGLVSASFNPWDYVVAVYVCLVIRSDTTGGGLTSAGAASTYRRCPVTAAEAQLTGPVEIPNTDGILRRSYFEVFNIRARSSFDPSS